MKFIYGKQDFLTQCQAEEVCWLLTDGRGGYASTSAAFSVTRNDQGLLIHAETAPTARFHLLHRVTEVLTVGKKKAFLSTQTFGDGIPSEDGWQQLSAFVWEDGPRWLYHVDGVEVRREVVMERETGTSALLYRITNRSKEPCTLSLTPYFQFCPKGEARQNGGLFLWDGEAVRAEGRSLFIRSNGRISPISQRYQQLFYNHDAKDGRAAKGLAAACVTVTLTVPAGETGDFEVIFSAKPTKVSAEALLRQQKERMSRLRHTCGFRHSVAQELAVSADAYLSQRDSTGGMTILAGYPFFGDWGRDTMIALAGCTLSTKRYAEAKSILRTFFAYEKDGLVPNLFPEGQEQPRYNTVDAALLLINCVWLYWQATGDDEFVKEAFPVLARIITAYQKGTHHGIHMDTDGLILAGKGFDQVTWMDVCVNGILPTPRHGKPVEINAYWYNALRIMERFAPLCGQNGGEYAHLAEKVKASFREKFWKEEGYLKDVLSDTHADDQIRCNQIWAVTMPFTMLTEEQERQVVDTVFAHLYTPCGLRSLSPCDREFHPTYGGDQLTRDLAYHQGTVWVFPLGAYYLAYLKVHHYSEDAKKTVLEQLEGIVSALREGCVGQLPEIYDGLVPAASQGCFAQAWSVGELLRVFEQLEKSGEKLPIMNHECDPIPGSKPYLRPYEAKMILKKANQGGRM